MFAAAGTEEEELFFFKVWWVSQKSVVIGHPGHVHLFKNLIKSLNSKSLKPLITTRGIPAVKELLRLYEIPFIVNLLVL